MSTHFLRIQAGFPDDLLHSMAQRLLAWFAANQRDLPWRRTYEPYHVWISEIMLQQTQMERGVEYFQRWMQRFPDIKTLASAEEDEVLKAWEGLGYYSRARNVHKTAKILMEKYQGDIPKMPQELRTLPGIGPYTAAAIASIAYEHPICALDANGERIVARLCALEKPIKARATQNTVQQFCQRWLKTHKSRMFTQALMEFGALICRPRQPACDICPLGQDCLAYQQGVQHTLPIKSKKPETIYVSMATGILRHQGYFYVQKRLPTDVWANLWEFPGGVIEAGEEAAQTIQREYLEETEFRVINPVFFQTFKHSYTRYRVTMHAFFVSLKTKSAEDRPMPTLHAAQEYRWASWDEVLSLAFPAGHRKLIETLNTDRSFLQDIRP